MFLALATAGCAPEITTGTSTVRPMPPDPRPAPETPADAVVSRMVFAVGSKPEDTDGNSYPDRIDATVMLFAPPHPSPVFAEGSFEISLYSSGASGKPGAKPLAHWSIAGEALQRAKHRTTIGPQYRLSLSLLDSGSDQYSLALADLVCTFQPEGGASPSVVSDGVRSIQIGK